jgi:hypothetical protein
MDDARHSPMDALESLRERAEGLEQWLRENAPEVAGEQAHLDEGTAARAYWNYGYLVALRDVLNAMDRGGSALN